MTDISRRAVSGSFPETLEAAKAGHEWAWVEIYTELCGRVTGYLASRGAAEPEDLAAEVFLQVARDIHRFDGNESSFRSWVFVIVHRRLIDARRAAGRRPVIADAEEDTIGGDVEEEAIEELTLARMHEIFDRLTEDQRDVLALRIIADLSLEEVAEIMGKRVGAIKALQRRALTAVKQDLDRGRVSL